MNETRFLSTIADIQEFLKISRSRSRLAIGSPTWGSCLIDANSQLTIMASAYNHLWEKGIKL